MFTTNSGWRPIPIIAIIIGIAAVVFFLPVSVQIILSILAIAVYIFFGPKREGFGSIMAFAFLLIVLAGIWFPSLLKLFIGN